jgi:flagellar basal-body rod protein FlgG
MIGGIYNSNTGLNALQYKMNVLSNNIANVNTEGFKQEKVTFKALVDANRIVPSETAYDPNVGSIKETGRELDFAANGDAYFTIHSPQGDKYVKKGSFSCDNSGYLIDHNGNRIAGVNGEVRMVKGKPDQDFSLVKIINKEYLVWTADGFETDPANISKISKSEGKALQGMLETSNVDLTYSLSEMIRIGRGFSFNSKMITTQDELLKKAAEEIGSLK